MKEDFLLCIWTILKGKTLLNFTRSHHDNVSIQMVCRSKGENHMHAKIKIASVPYKYKFFFCLMCKIDISNPLCYHPSNLITYNTLLHRSK